MAHLSLPSQARFRPNPLSTATNTLSKASNRMESAVRALPGVYRNMPTPKPRLIRHIGVLMVVLAILVASGLGTAGVVKTNQAAPKALVADDGFGGLVDKTATAYIAAEVAVRLELANSQEVTKRAEALSSQVALATTADNYLSKPQVITTGTRSGLETYTIKEGEDVAAVAKKFGITTNTVRWANNLSEYDILRAGQQIVILPINGVLHTVESGDTPENLASRYQANAQQIISYNDAEISGLRVGQQIVIPDGVKPTPRRTYINSYFANYVPQYNANGYSYGYCTYWAAKRRADVGKPVPSNWGNAISWRYYASASGYKVGSTPQPGAVVYHTNIGGLGHVAYVEQVNPDGSAVFSDMNYPIWGQSTTRFISASEMGVYLFIY